MTRVIHTGDTHIGYQQYHSPERRTDFHRAFEQVVEDAVAEEVDAVIHAGDLFHDRRPELQDLLGTISALRTLDDADIPFLAIVGNHESTRGGQWLDLFERLGLATRLGDEPVLIGEEVDDGAQSGHVAVYGLDHVPKSRRDDLDYDFADADASYAALVAHGLFEPFPHGNWDTETVLTEATVDFDAMLLGDNHAPDTATVAGTWVTYCGSTERASADERDARGYNLVEFDPDARDDADRDGAPAGVDIRRRSLDDATRDFTFVSVELAEGEGVERTREQIRQHDLDDAVAIVEIEGDGDPVTPADVESFALEEGALIARVTDRREKVDAETDFSVSFADPDDAVRERVGELGLSTAALGIDETVRASKTADANVRQRVRDRVEDLLGDAAAFDSAAESGGESAKSDDAGDGADDGESTDADDDESDESTDTGDDADDGSINTGDDAGDGSTDTGEGDSTSAGSDAGADVSGDAEDVPVADASTGDVPAEETENAASDAESDGQASMEEYL